MASSPTNTEPHIPLEQQEVITDLGKQALETADLHQLIRNAAVAVAETLDADYCSVFEQMPGGDEVVLREGVGWQDGLVGNATVPIDADSQIGDTLLAEEPVIVDDLWTDERFSGSELLSNHNVVSGISVIIGPIEEPWGVLGAHATEQRAFTQHDATFIQNVATILASAIENDQTQSKREEVYGRISDGFFALDETWRFTYLNERAHELINTDDRTLVGEHIWDEFPRATEREFKPKYEQAMYEQETISFEEYYPDPLDAWFEVRAYPSDTGLSVYFRDVTDRKKRERELTKYETIVETISDGIYVKDEDGRFTMVNDAYAELTGYDCEGLVGEHASLVVDEATIEESRERLTASAGDDAINLTLEAEIQTADGDRIPAEGTFATLQTADGDQAEIGVVRDISDRKERKRELQRKERQFEAIFEDPNILVGLLEPDGTVLDINQTAMEYIDADLAEVTGEPFWETPWWGEGDGIQDDVREWTNRAAAGEYVDFEADLTRPDGQQYTLNGVFRPVTNDDDEVVSIIVSDRDITERRQRERELEESERRYRTLAEYFPNGIVALFDHDLRYELAAGQAFEKISVEPDEVEGRHFSDVWDTETATALRPAFEAALSGKEQSVELAYEGREWVVHAVPITDERGDVFAGMTMAQDITEQKEYERKLRERQRALEESERRYRTLIENFPNGSVGLFNEDLEYTAVGGQLMDRLEMKPEDRIGRSIHELHPDDLVEEIGPYFREALTGKANFFEVEFRGRHLHAHTLPVRNADDEIFAGMLVIQDFTERREMKRELRESEAKFQMIAENLEEVVWMATADAEEFIYVNPAFEEIWGLDRETLYDEQLSFLEAVSEEDRERVRKAFNALPEDEFDEKFRISRPDREVRWVHARGSKVEDENGEIVRIVGIGEDITAQVERERELERALDLLNKTERIADVAGWEVVPGTQEVFWSDHLFDLLDVAYEEQPSLEEALDVYYTEDDRTIVENAVEEALTTSNPFDVEARFPRPSGDIGWLRVQGDPMVENGEVVSLRGAVQDVTERKEREQRLEELIDQLEESNERLEQFAYAASHDLREPLRMVSSYLQLIERRYADNLDEDGQEFIEFAVDGAERMREMIEGLLEYSRVDTRGDPFEPVDLNELLADVRDDLHVRIEESDAEISVEDLPCIEGDDSQLRQLFQNLLDNAIEYCGDEPPRIHVSAHKNQSEQWPAIDTPQHKGDHNEWVISVSDEGIGIDPDDADRAFEVFQSLHTPDDHDGTGIGLALCERIVERHGGEIWVDSEPGEGATFSFTLPAAQNLDK